MATVLTVTVGLVLLTPLLLAAQRKSSATASPPLKTPWGHPDLGGVWDFSTNTPMERPPELKGKTKLTDEMVAERLQQVVGQRQRQDNSAAREGDTGTYNRFWTDEARVTNQTSLVTDPPDGRIPAYTPAAQQWYAELAAARKGVDMDAPTPGGFVDDLGPRGLFVRCIVGFNAGPPVKPQSYNQNVQIFRCFRHQVLLRREGHGHDGSSGRPARVSERQHVA